MNNLEPRAKIGDVVIVRKLSASDEVRQYRVDYAYFDEKEDFWRYNSWDTEITDTRYYHDQDILKNLTTNVSYE